MNAAQNNAEWKRRHQKQTKKRKPRKMRQRHHELQQAKDGTYWYQHTPKSTKIELPASLVRLGEKAVKKLEEKLR